MNNYYLIRLYVCLYNSNYCVAFYHKTVCMINLFELFIDLYFNHVSVKIRQFYQQTCISVILAFTSFPGASFSA